MKRCRFLSLILALSLTISLFPQTALAAESTQSADTDTTAAAETDTDTEETETEDPDSDSTLESGSGSETDTIDETDAADSSGSSETEETSQDDSADTDAQTSEASDAPEETSDAADEAEESENSTTEEEDSDAALSTLASYTSYSYSYSYTSVNSVTLSPSSISISDVLEETTDFIISEEGSYSSATADDNGALSLGVLQWHGSNALILMRLIVSADNATAYSTLGSSLYNEIISSSTSWGSRTLSSSEVTKFSTLLSTSTGQSVQKKLAQSYVASYLNAATSLGIVSPGALLIFADVANQRGLANAKLTALTASYLAGSYSAIMANEMLMASIYRYSTSSSYYSSFVSRRFRSYKYVVETLGWEYCSSDDILIAYSYATAISTATTWLQYALNAVSDAGLTVDGSYGSLTAAAVLAFQEDHDLDADGIAGPLTLAAIITDLVDYLLDGGTLITDSDSSSSSTTEAESTLSISSYNYPTSITAGNSFSIYGTVSSNYTITNVTVSVLSSSGSTKLSASATPNATSYSIANLDAKITFGSLSAGTYTYVITATDSKTTKTLVSKSFTVTAASTLAISSYNYPTSYTKGSSFTIKGTIKSNYKITSVKVQILNSSGTSVSSASATPNATSYSLSNLSSKLKFSSLSTGTYTYKVTATDTQTSKTLVSKSFTVTAASTLAISSYNYPTTIKVGSSYSIKGTIKSNYTISKVTVTVVNSSGKTVLSASASPNAKSYSVAKLDSKIKFGSLSAGTYTYKITATDSKKSKTLVSKTFKVRSLTISSYNYPTSITKGKSFSIKGTIKSSYKITKVTVKVVDSDGDTVLSASATPNAKSYSIKKLDSKIKFSKLSKGTYTYKVIATDTKTSSVTLLSKSFKVK